jgi:hypothetical protein
MISPYPNALFIQTLYSSYPLNITPLLYFGFCPQNPCKMIENEMRVFCILLNIWLLYYDLCNLHMYNN